MVDVDRRQHVTLGLAERWIIGMGALAIASLVGVAWTDMSAQDAAATAWRAQFGDKQNDLAEAQQVTNARLTMVIAQLADVPGLSRNVAELDVQVQRNTSDIRDLRQARGLK